MDLSPLFKLNGRDLLKGAVVAVVSAILAALGVLVNCVSACAPLISEANGKYILGVAFTAFISYLAKNLATDDQGKVLGKL